MSFFEKHPHHVRRRIAFLWTGIVAVVLIIILLIVYIHPKRDKEGKPRTKFGDFYETISDTTQSFFGAK